MTRLDPEQVKAATDIVQLVSRYTQLRKQGSEYVGLCFLHNDTTAPGNLYVNPQKQVWACFACGAHEQHGADAIGFLRSAENIDFPEAVRRLANGSGTLPPPNPVPAEPLKKAPPRENLTAPDGDIPDMRLAVYGEPTGIWAYRTAEGGILGYVCRYHDPQRGKTLRCFSYGRYGEVDPPRWECKAFSSPRPLYGLELLAGRPEAQVLLVEGEKSADAARQLIPAMLVMTWAGGANAGKYADWSVLAGRNVVLWPDADAPGRQAMERVAALLKGVAAEIKGIDPDTQPDGSATPEGWDAADALAAGWDREQTLAWAKQRITVYVAPQQEQHSASSVRTQLAEYPPESPSDAPESPVANAEPGPSQTIPDSADAQEAPFPQAGEASATMPEAEFPPEASTTRPKRPRKPTLASVDGNTVRVLEIEPEPEMLPAYAEAVLADRFVAGVGKEYRYTAGWSSWHKWDGFRWILDDTKKITWDAFMLVREVARESREATAAQRARVTTLKQANSVIGLAASYPSIATKAEVWDRDPMLLGTPDGVIDLKTGKLTTSERDQYITRSVAVSPVRGDCPHWVGVIDRATKGDTTMRDYLQRWCGYILTGDTREECFLFVYGPGGSGKSTFIRVLSAIMGDYSRSAKMDAFQAKDRQEHSEEIARLAGARLVSATETDEGARWNESRIKTLTGRDKIAARHMHKDTFEFLPQFKLVFAGNHKPTLRSVGEEMRRRIHLVAFDETIPEEERDRKLGAKLEAEYPAILQWMIDGCLAWQDFGLGRPEAVTTAVENYLRDEDTFGSWIDDCLEIEKGAFTQSSDAYANYERWCDKNGEHYKLSQKRFSQKLEDRGYPRGKSAGSRGFFGFSLRVGANL